MLLAALGAPTAAQAASGPGSAVVLVSGFDTVSPFSTSDPSCAGKEGPAWNPPTGVAQALKGAGFTVFTAPVMQEGGPPATPCAPGTAVPPVASTYINSNGDLTANGQALGNFIAFLRANYGVTKIDLVAHSDGGLWSRSAITQQSNYPGVAVTSLTTLGTPHTGSFIADIAEDFDNGQCKAPNPIAQAVCLALQNVVGFVIKDLGPIPVHELSSDYLSTWNPEQRMGACPVTGVAGTYFNFPLPPSILSGYYNPSDGLVGQASALGQAAKSIYGNLIPAAGIPNFQVGGSFPVVHGSSFSFLSDQNLLNQTAISNLIVSTLKAQPSTGATCTAPTPPPPATTDGLVNLTIPLHAFAAPRHRTLPPTRLGDTIVFSSRARLRCGRRTLTSTAFPGHPELRVTFARCKRRLRVKGKGRVLLIRAIGTATIGISGNTVTVRTHGIRVRRVGLQLLQGQSFVRIPLRHSVRGTLPAGAGPTTLRVEAITRKPLPRLRGRTLVGSATVSR